jgi:antitoxin FitA
MSMGMECEQEDTSMEDKARNNLRTAPREEPAQTGSLADAIRARIEPLGGLQLSMPRRRPSREPPRFE